jgi:DNA integrity scanning protein DisA with diadenylate cyclase activity
MGFFPWPMMGADEEIKTLEEYKDALTKRLEKVNEQLEALKLKKVVEK